MSLEGWVLLDQWRAHPSKDAYPELRHSHWKKGPLLLAVASRTSVELVYDSLQPFLEGDGVGGTLERESELSVLNAPVVEDWVHLVVHQTPLHSTLQHWLQTQNVPGGVQKEKQGRMATVFMGACCGRKATWQWTRTGQDTTHTLTARSRSRSPHMMYSLRPLPS